MNSITSSDFADLDLQQKIGQEARGNAPEQFEHWLAQDENLETWYEHLVQLQHSIQVQISERSASLQTLQQSSIRRGPQYKDEYFQAKAEFDTWRAGALRFKLRVESRLVHVKALRRQRADREHARRVNPPVSEGGSDDLIAHVAALTKRIQAIEEWLYAEPNEGNE